MRLQARPALLGEVENEKLVSPLGVFGLAGGQTMHLLKRASLAGWLLIGMVTAAYRRAYCSSSPEAKVANWDRCLMKVRRMNRWVPLSATAALSNQGT
jgi:hypothetical protein